MPAGAAKPDAEEDEAGYNRDARDEMDRLLSTLELADYGELRQEWP